VPEGEGLRPTPDRIRETLFNWLAFDVPGAHVLDCFAGAGGLGFEAASREARRVTMIDKARSAVTSLQRQSAKLGTQNIELIHDDVLHFLAQANQPFDLVFIDPPYAQGHLREQVLDALLEKKLLNNKALIYMEWPQHQQMQLNHAELTWVKQKKASCVCYAIAQYDLTG